jgi:hypothetical protein
VLSSVQAPSPVCCLLQPPRIKLPSWLLSIELYCMNLLNYSYSLVHMLWYNGSGIVLCEFVSKLICYELCMDLCAVLYGINLCELAEYLYLIVLFGFCRNRIDRTEFFGLFGFGSCNFGFGFGSYFTEPDFCRTLIDRTELPILPECPALRRSRTPVGLGAVENRSWTQPRRSRSPESGRPDGEQWNTGRGREAEH